MKKFSIALLAAIIAGCGGGGSSSPTPTVAVASVTPTPVVQQPACVNPHTDNTYPDSFKGAYTIPTVSNTLPNSINRSVGLKDYTPISANHWTVFSTTSNACTGTDYTKILYKESLDRLQSLGVDHVWLYIGGSWTVDPNLSYWVQKPENLSHSYQLMEYIVTEAKKRNIKVYLAWQLNIIDDKNNFLLQLGQVVDKKLWATILESHHKNIVNIAKFGESVGVAGINADWNAMNIGNLHDPVMQEMYVQEIVSIIDDMRKVFKGKITWGQGTMPWHDYRIIDRIDALHVSIMPRLSDSEMINFNSDTVMNVVSKEIYRYYQDINCIWPSHNYCTPTRSGKEVPIIFEIAVQSRDKYFKEGWVEDGFCLPGTTTDGKKVDCIQTTYVTDFSVQAIGIDGILKAIKSQSYFKVDGVNFHTSYWHTDTLKPSTGFVQTQYGIKEDSEGFPNLSQSIRGKPAESVVKQWFKRP